MLHLRGQNTCCETEGRGLPLVNSSPSGHRKFASAPGWQRKFPNSHLSFTHHSHRTTSSPCLISRVFVCLRYGIEAGMTRLWSYARLILIMAILVDRVQAGTTGKLSGVVVDAETGERLPGVNVSVIGSFRGAATDAHGEYLILNVPAGTYDVAATMIGYTRLTITNVRVLPDFTSRIEFQLRPQNISADEIVVVAERPLIQKDQTMTLSVMPAEELSHLPIRGFQEAASLGVGFVISYDRDPEGGQARSVVRGGRKNELGVMIDGFLQNNLITGIANTPVPNQAIEEVVSITGAYDAEYGRFQSGILQIRTRSGGSRYSGFLEYVNDRPMVVLDKDQYFGYDTYSAGFGGPLLPGNDRVRFFVSTELRDITDAEPSVFGFPKFRLSTEGSVNDDPGKPDTVIFQTDENGNLLFTKGARPKNPQGYGINSDRGGGITAKLSVDWIPSALRLDLSGNYSETYRRTFVVYRTISGHNLRHEISNLNVGGILTYQISPAQLIDLGINYHTTLRKRMNDAYGLDFDAYNSFRGNTGFWTYYGDLLLADIGSIAGATSPRKYEDRYVAMKSNYLYQVDKHHQLKAGVDLFLHTVRFLDDIFVDGSRYHFNGIGWRLDGPNIVSVAEDDLEDGLLGPARPVFFAAYAQDKIEYEGLVVRGGLRYDLFNSGAKAVKNFEDPLGQRDPDQVGQFTDANGNGLPDERELWAGRIGPEDYGPSKGDHRISTRLSVSFPISERTQFRLSYGQFFQQPNLEFLYSGPLALEDAALNGRGFIIGNPNLKAEKTVQYEVGLKRALGDRASIDISAYYKDIHDLISHYYLPSDPNSFLLFVNADEGVVKGIGMSMELRRWKKFQGRASYTIQSAIGSGYSAYSGYRRDFLANPKTQVYAPLAFDQRHTLNVDVDIRNAKGEGPVWAGRRILENAGFNLLVNLGSGLPYTPTTPDHIYLFRFQNAVTVGRKNSARMPWTMRIDVKADKSIQLTQHVSFNAYVQILNLSNRRNVINVWSSTGVGDNNGFLTTPFGQTMTTREVQQFQVWFHDGFRYDTPRQFRLGMILNF